MFLNCDFLFFAFLSSIRFLFSFFLFFFLLHFVHHTLIPIGFHPLLFFLYFLLDSRTSLSLSFSSSLIFYSLLFFPFLLDSINSLALSVILSPNLTCLFTISASSVTSVVSCSVGGTGSTGSSTGKCCWRLRETCSTDLSLTGARSFAVV